MRGPDQWQLPNDLVASFGRCAAKALWFYGFRVATLAPLIDPVPLRWALAAAFARRGIRLLTPPTKQERPTMPTARRRFIAAHRNRVEGSFTTLKGSTPSRTPSHPDRLGAPDALGRQVRGLHPPRRLAPSGLGR